MNKEQVIEQEVAYFHLMIPPNTPRYALYKWDFLSMLQRPTRTQASVD